VALKLNRAEQGATKTGATISRRENRNGGSGSIDRQWRQWALNSDELRGIIVYRRPANYLSVDVIYLCGNLCFANR
jgi:hypothetical protein